MGLIKSKVFVKGDAHTPARFWKYSLSTRDDHPEFFGDKDYVFSKEDTDEYNALSAKEKMKIKFTYINGKHQKY